MRAHETGDGEHKLGDGLLGGKPADWGPVSADGAPNPALANPTPAPARPFTPRYCPCLRDCEHYMTVTSHFEHGAGAGVLQVEPTERHHICSAIPGVYLELSGDSPVYACNRWTPMLPETVTEEERRRDAWLRDNAERMAGPADESDELTEAELESEPVESEAPSADDTE